MGRRQRPAPPPSKPDDEEELDIQAFSDSLAPSGLAIRDVNNDGNCFFRAVSDQLYGTEDYHMKLRERACDYLERHREHYKHFIDEEQSFDEYVADMRQDGVWADNLELQAISMACDVNIRVHQSGKPSYDIRNHPGNRANAMHLSYHFGEHYASVRPLRTAHLRVPAQHDPLPLPNSSSSSQEEDRSSEERLTRRPRQKHRCDLDIVAAVWKRANRGYCDLCALVDKTRRAAKNIRSAESASAEEDERLQVARKIERDMRDARAQLDDVGARIQEGKAAHRAHMKQSALEGERRASHLPSSQSEYGNVGTEDDDEAEEQYRRYVRQQTDAIFGTLNDTENAVRQALGVVASWPREGSGEGGSSKPPRSSKKKEQEARRKERKERRRKEQERTARGESDDMYSREMIRLHQLDIAI